MVQAGEAKVGFRFGSGYHMLVMVRVRSHLEPFNYKITVTMVTSIQ